VTIADASGPPACPSPHAPRRPNAERNDKVVGGRQYARSSRSTYADRRDLRRKSAHIREPR
jgi:hypothetical protein